MMNDLNERISIQKFIEALLDENTDENSISFNRFSDLEEADLAVLKEKWLKIKTSRRSKIMRELKEIAESDTLVCFDGVALLALDDPESSVRVNAIELLWEYEQKCLIPILIEMLQNDPEIYVRAAAATGLGKFIYLGEMEEIPSDAYLKTENALLDAINSQDDKEVRQHALEAISFSCHKAAQNEIRKAYASEDPTWVACSMFAMGHSADSRWADMVMENLDHPASDVQYAAVRAAGELELDEARDPLLMLLESSDQFDEELYNAIVWSLSQIGGENVRSALEYLLETEEEDADAAEILETALENLEFNEGLQVLDMFDLELTEDDDLYNTDEMEGNIP